MTPPPAVQTVVDRIQQLEAALRHAREVAEAERKRADRAELSTGFTELEIVRQPDGWLERQ
jgi:hypothetical protein